MAFRNLFCAGACGIVLAGCSIHPLPDNVTRDSTLDIVKKIRCEAKRAVVYELMEVIVRNGSPQNINTIRMLLSGDVADHELDDLLAQRDRNKEKILELLVDFSSDDELLALKDTDVDSVDFPGQPSTLTSINRFRYVGLTFTFTFTITENNNRISNAGFKMPFTGGSFSLAVKKESKKGRENERIIAVPESFSGLVRNVRCDDVDRPRKHWVYPITGNIGIREYVTSFTDIAKLTGDVVPTFSDELTFTTKFAGQINPSVAINDPPLKYFRLVSADIDVNADRTDIHMVKLVIKDRKTKPVKPVDKKFTLGSNGDLTLVVPLPKMVSGRKTSRKTTETRRRSPDYLPEQRPRAAVRRPAGNLLAISPADDRAIKADGIIESRRLDSINRQRDLNEIIGR